LEYFENIRNSEQIYEELQLRGVLDTLPEPDRKTLVLIYHLFLQANYFSEGVSLSSILRPFVTRLLGTFKKQGK